MKPMSPRESRLVAVGILVALIAAVWLAVVDPLIEGFSERAETRQTLLDTYSRNQRVLAGIALWQAELEQQRETASKFAIAAPTEALAAEQLKSRLTRMTSDVGGTLTAIQDIQDGVPNGFVRVRADMQMTLGQLYKSLARLESEEPYVVVESLSVVADRAAQTGHLGPMAVRVEVSAPIRISQSS
jgi:hypothetical protein